MTEREKNKRGQKELKRKIAKIFVPVSFGTAKVRLRLLLLLKQINIDQMQTDYK